MRDNYDFSGAKKNPHAKRLKEEGYSVLIHYSPEDVAKIDGAKECELTPEEKAAFDEYRKAQGH